MPQPQAGTTSKLSQLSWMCSAVDKLQSTLHRPQPFVEVQRPASVIARISVPRGSTFPTNLVPWLAGTYREVFYV